MFPFFRCDTWARFDPLEWKELRDTVNECLGDFRAEITQLLDGFDTPYVQEWDDHLADDEEPYEGYGMEESAQTRHAEFMAGQAAAHATRVAALHAREYIQLQAWLAENGHGGLYALFEEHLREEYALGFYPGVPVRDARGPYG